MKRIGKIIFWIVAIVMVCTIIYYLFSHVFESPFVRNNVWRKESKSSDSKKEGKSEKKPPYMVSKHSMGILPYSGNTYDIKKWFPMENLIPGAPEASMHMKGCVNKVIFTKQAIDTDAAYYVESDADNPVQFDENYNILNDFSYVSVNMTIENLSDRDTEIYLNSFRFMGIDPDTKQDIHVFYGGELRGFKTRKDLLTYDKSYAAVTIPGGQGVTYNFVYIQRDSDFKDNIPYIKFFATGFADPKYDQKSIYVRLK